MLPVTQGPITECLLYLLWTKQNMVNIPHNCKHRTPNPLACSQCLGVRCTSLLQMSMRQTCLIPTLKQTFRALMQTAAIKHFSRINTRANRHFFKRWMTFFSADEENWKFSIFFHFGAFGQGKLNEHFLSTKNSPEKSGTKCSCESRLSQEPDHPDYRVSINA